MKHTYENAKILPPALLAEIQEYVSGVYLWIPTTNPEKYIKRNWEIYYQCRIRKLPHKIVAPKFGITTRRVRQILQKLDKLENNIPPQWKEMRDKLKTHKFKGGRMPKKIIENLKNQNLKSQKPKADEKFNFDD